MRRDACIIQPSAAVKPVVTKVLNTIDFTLIPENRHAILFPPIA